jgi:carboxymethylenebutenolidase
MVTAVLTRSWKPEEKPVPTENPILAHDGSRQFNAYLARPNATAVSGVLVLQDMFGLNEPIRAYADSLAARGFAALVPNLFWRSEISGVISYDNAQHAAAWARLKALDLRVVTEDMQSAIGWLRGQTYCNGKVGAVGFCGGGRFAYLAAARCDVDAAASLYGLGISEHLGELNRVKCPLQLHYGGDDQHVPQTEVDAVSAGVRGKAGIEVLVYPGAGHSFANPVRPTYDPAATQLANQRIEAMLKNL